MPSEPPAELPPPGGLAEGPAFHEELRGLVQGLERGVAALLQPLASEASELRAQRAALAAENEELRAQLAAALPASAPGGEPAKCGGRPPRQSVASTRAVPCLGDVGGGADPDARGASAFPEPAQVPLGATVDAREQLAVNTTEELPTAILLHVGGGGGGHPEYRSSRTCSGDLDDASSLRANLMVDLLPFWKDLEIGSPTRRKSKRSLNKVLQRRQTMASLQHLEMHGTSPMARRRLLWETLGAMCIIYDLIQVPLTFSFHVEFDRLMMIMLYLHVAYWSADFVYSFFVGYFVDGVLETRFARTARRYLKTWFFVDLCLLLNDWMMVLFEWLADREAEEQMLYFRVWRVFRLVRFLRLVRILKLHNLFAKMVDNVRSENVLTILQVFEHIVLIVIMNHFIACAWYWIGTVAHVNNGWTHVRFDENRTLGYRYSTSLHWSLTQFTPASMEVVPTNATERTFNVCVIILALVTFSTFISSITNAMTRFRQSNGLIHEQKAEMRRYLGENRVSMQLAMRVWRHVQQGSKFQRRRMMWCDVELFRGLPEIMQMDLQQEVYVPTLVRHPFLREYSEHDPAAMRAICHSAAKERPLVAEQVLFDEGQAVSHMHFVLDGALDYRPGKSASTFGQLAEGQVLTRGHWVGEAAIWVRWFYQGAAAAKGYSVVLEMNVQKLHQVMKEYTEMLPFCSAYAALFVGVAKAKASESSDLTDDVATLEALVKTAAEQGLLEDPVRSRSKGLFRKASSKRGQGLRSGSLVSLSAILRKSPTAESNVAQ